MQPTNGDVLRVFWQHTRKYSGRVLLILFGLVVAVGSQTVVPWYFKQFFDVLAAPATPDATQVLFGIFLAILILRVVMWIGWRIVGFVTIYFQPYVMADLEQSVFDQLLGHSYQFFVDNFAGSLVRKVRRIANAFEKVNDEIEFRIIPIILIVIGAVIGIAIRFPLVAGLFLIWTIIYVLLNYVASMWKLKIDTKRTEADSETTGVLADALTNSITVKMFTGAEEESRRYRDILKKWKFFVIWSWNRGETIFGMQAALMIAFEIGTLMFMVNMWKQNLVTVGDLALIQGYLFLAYEKLWEFGRSFRHIFESFADAREAVHLMQSPYEVKDKLGAKELRAPNGVIGFEQVSFQFHQTRHVLKDFNLEIPAKQKLALVGPSGAGKSTITKLLFRFYDVDAGKITIDGQDVAGVTQKSLREHISLVPQEPILFHRTIMENIRYGRRDATNAEVIDAAKKARCHEFISELPSGYETFVGERGVKLSGGERQRVAIARAMLRNAPILILDEATSSLDSESERLIHEALKELMHDKTAIVIAHRLSTIMEMDRIVVIENGAVVDSGTHAELLEKVGTYQNLWSIQAGAFTDRSK